MNNIVKLLTVHSLEGRSHHGQCFLHRHLGFFIFGGHGLEKSLDDGDVYYRVHDMFSRIFQVRIYEFFHRYVLLVKKGVFFSFEHLRKSKQILHNIW